MVAKPLDMSLVYKRERSLLGDKKYSVSEVNLNLNLDISSIKNPELIRNKVEYALETSNSYTKDLMILECLYKNNQFNILENSVQDIMKNVIPSIHNKDLNKAINITEAYNIGSINRDRLIETCKSYKSIDRIIDNHKKIAKRFALENVYDIGKSEKAKCVSLCEMVDTYSIMPFIKLNIALEEMKYMNYFGGVSIDEASMVKYITEYFLLRENNDQDDIDSYVNAIRNSKVLSETADSKVKYLMNKNEDKSLLEGLVHKNWKESLNEWMITPNKNIDTLSELCINNSTDIAAMSSILSVMEDYIDENQLDNNIASIFENTDKISLPNGSAANIIKILKENNTENAESLIENLTYVWMEDINDIQYADGDHKGELTTFSTDEIDKFRMHNLVSDAQATADALDHMEKTFNRNNMNCCKDSIDDTNFDKCTMNSIADYVDCNEHVLLRIRSYSINENANLEDVINFMESTVKCINNSLYNHDSKVIYQFRNESTIDVFTKSNYKVILSLYEEEHRLFPNSLKGDLVKFFEDAKESDTIGGLPTEKMVTNYIDKSKAAIDSVDEVYLMCEMFGPLEETSGIVKDYVNTCDEACNPKIRRIKEITKSHQSYDIESSTNIPVSARLESLCVLSGAMNPADSTIYSEAVARNGKSINTIKLAWQGFRSSLKHADAKEKEMCRDMDAGFNNFVRGFNSLYKTDHREAIIKGQVCPSLSKMLKIAIALAGVGLATGSPYIPALIMVCGFIANKHCSDIERHKMIDELDIELKVVARELERADSHGSTKKYRQLLTIQRNLLRERQKLYYKLAVKGKKVNPIDQNYLKN